MSDTTSSVEPAAQQPFPKLTASEFRAYNHMAEHMDYFHNHFRQSWTLMYNACVNKSRPKGLSLRQFINTGLTFCHHLEMHHGIEEQHIFPVLAKKMPAFQKELELLTQHKQIHAGLDTFQEYLEQCRDGESELRLEEMKALMDKFGGVLWAHLDDEVKQLGA
ncbi:hypothetical protein MMC25_004998 [Agyrium rufum]|nr:hypothetical protein [Agyrium rufum]